MNTSMKHAFGKALILLTLLVLVSSAAQANTYVWKNPAGGNWQDPTSWNPNGVPGLSDIASLTASGSFGFSPGASYTITLTNIVIASNLTLVVHSSSNQTV